MSKIECNLKKAVKNAKRCCGNATILAEKCKSTMTFGSKRWALNLLLRQTHTEEEDNSNCGKSCLQSNRHFYLKLSNFLNGGFRVLFSSLWASLDDLLFTSLDTRYYRRLAARVVTLEAEVATLEARVSLLTIYMFSRDQADEEVGDKKTAILAMRGQIKELLTSDAELTVDQMKKLERELKEICKRISSSHGQQVAGVASTSAAGGSHFAAGCGIKAADQLLHPMDKQLYKIISGSTSAPRGNQESEQKQPQQEKKGGGRWPWPGRRQTKRK